MSVLLPEKLCPACDHPWTRHDPKDGTCQARSNEQDVHGPCRCGRELKFHTRANALLARNALTAPLGRERSSLRLRRTRSAIAIEQARAR